MVIEIMAEIKIHLDRFSKDNKLEILNLCPFAAIEESEETGLVITSACKMCMLCVKKGPPGLFVLVNEKKTLQDHSFW